MSIRWNDPDFQDQPKAEATTGRRSSFLGMRPGFVGVATPLLIATLAATAVLARSDRPTPLRRPSPLRWAASRFAPGVDPRMIVPAPRGIDEAMIHEGRPGIDPRMIVPAFPSPEPIPTVPEPPAVKVPAQTTPAQ